MITIENTIQLPDCWEDLTPAQVSETLRYSFDYLGGKFDLYTYRFMLLQLYTGYERSKTKFTADEAETINSNLFFLASKLRFTLRPVYKNGQYLKVLTPELQQKLQTVFPFELTEPNELAQIEMVYSKLEFYPALNLNFKANPLPVIKTGKTNLQGAVFSIDKHGDVHTNISAAMFCDAYDYYSYYNKLNEPEYLNYLVAILYRPAGYNYSMFGARLRASDQIKNVDPISKRVVYSWFQGIMEWLFAHPVYGMLFSGGGNTGSQKINMGMSEILFSLSKEGYGSPTELENEDVMKFLARQIKRLKDMVAELRGMELNAAKIAEKTKLPIETINAL